MMQFLSFLNAEGLEVPRKHEFLDDLVAEYLEHLWSTGAGRALASDTVASLQDFDPKLKGMLPASWRLLTTWKFSEILRNSKPPMPEVVLRAMVGKCLFAGDRLMALSLLLGFYSMLRTGELLAVVPNHFHS